MSLIVDKLKLTFLDKDGSLAIPEITAAFHAIMSIAAIAVALAAFIRQVWIKDQPPDFIAFSTGIAALVAGVSIVVAALGTAQRVRDGLWKPDGDHP